MLRVVVGIGVSAVTDALVVVRVVVVMGGGAPRVVVVMIVITGVVMGVVAVP